MANRAGRIYKALSDRLFPIFTRKNWLGEQSVSLKKVFTLKLLASKRRAPVDMANSDLMTDIIIEGIIVHTREQKSY